MKTERALSFLFVSAAFLCVFFGAPICSQAQDTLPMDPLEPLSPKDYSECAAYQRQWGDLSNRLDRMHEDCLDSHRRAGEKANPEANINITCSFSGCQALHTRKREVELRQRPAIEQCRVQVGQYLEAERLRKEEEERMRAEDERKRAEEEARKAKERAEAEESARKNKEAEERRRAETEARKRNEGAEREKSDKEAAERRRADDERRRQERAEEERNRLNREAKERLLRADARERERLERENRERRYTEERQRAEDERRRVEEERQSAEEERQRVKEERRRVEEERRRVEEERRRAAEGAYVRDILETGAADRENEDLSRVIENRMQTSNTEVGDMILAQMQKNVDESKDIFGTYAQESIEAIDSATTSPQPDSSSGSDYQAIEPRAESPFHDIFRKLPGMDSLRKSVSEKVSQLKEQLPALVSDKVLDKLTENDEDEPEHFPDLGSSLKDKVHSYVVEQLWERGTAGTQELYARMRATRDGEKDPDPILLEYYRTEAAAHPVTGLWPQILQAGGNVPKGLYEYHKNLVEKIGNMLGMATAAK